MKKLRVVNISKYFLVGLSIILIAVLGSVFVNLGMPWYNTLQKPFEWVPSITFPIVWTIIYSLFAIFLFVWLRNKQLTNKTIILLVLNGLFNVLWCLVFFALNQLLIGNIVIISNLILAFLLIGDIFGYSKVFGVLLSIYPLWISIATTLNTAVWILN